MSSSQQIAPRVESEHNRLKWSGAGFTRRPVWPRNPDLVVMKRLAKKHLLSVLPSDFDDAKFHVQFFAEGSFNKLYRVSYATHPTSYMFRVTLPTDPFDKVESEVATLAFLRAKTSIPVARVFAWDFNCDSELVFEWLLTEMIKGVTLHDVWRQVPWARKVSLTEEMAGMIEQLERHKFDKIGSLYFASALELENSEQELQSQVRNVGITDEEVAVMIGSEEVEIEKLTIGSSPPATSKDNDLSSTGSTERKKAKKDRNLESTADFTIGHMFDEVFVSESRIYLPGNRGPFQSSLEWMQAAVAMQVEYINKGMSVSKFNADETENSEYDTSFQKDAPRMKELCYGILNILPEIFKDEKKGSDFVLHHHDISAANILVNPETFEITGILDWEMICVVPRWKTATEPSFLEYIEYDWESLSKEPPLPPSWDEEKDGYAIEDYDRWAYKQLRKHYNAVLKKIRHESGIIDDLDPVEVDLKQQVNWGIWDVVNGWQSVDWWLRRYMNGGADPDQEISSDEETDEESPPKDESCTTHRGTSEKVIA